MRPLAVTVLALLVTGCGSGYRVHLPSGWADTTRSYGGGLEQRLNAEAAPWAEVEVQQVWQDERSKMIIVASALSHPPPLPLRVLARRMIRTGNENVINFVLLREPTATRVDRAPAVIYDYGGSPPYGAVRVRVVLIRHANTFHLVSLTTTPYRFPAGSARLAEILDSWRWERAGSVDQPLLHPVDGDPPQRDGEHDQEAHA